MSIAPDTYLARFEAAARAAEREETEFRKGYAERLAALERARSFAHRRLNLVRALSNAIDGAEDAAEAIKAGAGVLNADFGLSADNPAHAPIIAAFAPVSDEIDTLLNCEDAPNHEAVMSALKTFEDWYEARTGTPFLALYDVDFVPDTPVVDF